MSTNRREAPGVNFSDHSMSFLEANNSDQYFESVTDSRPYWDRENGW